MIKELKNHIWKYVLLIIRPKEYRFRNIFLSLLGIQIIRIIFYKIEYSLKSIFYQNKNIDAPNKTKMKFNHSNSKEAFKELNKKGIIKIDNYFSNSTFKKLSSKYEKVLAKLPFGEFVSGALIKTISIDSTETDPDRLYIYNTFVNDKYLESLVSQLRKGKVYIKPRVILQTFKVPKGKKDLGDAVSVPHSDRLFHHAKLFFYMNDQSLKEGAYEYCEGSNKYNLWRLIHEIEADLRESFFRFFKFLGIKLNIKNVEHGLIKINPFLNKKINNKLSAISSSKNTFVLSDNRGFHSRGNMKEGTTRKQIRIQYQYLEIPFYSKLMLRLLYFYNKKFYRAYF